MLKQLVSSIKKYIPRRVIKGYHLAKAFVAVCVYRYPARDLIVIGVTGTDGKTTTCHMIYSMLRKAGYSVSLITSTGAIISGDETKPIGLHVTTPGSFLLQRLLSEAKASGSKYVVLETTSHALDQHRVFGCNFRIGVITNVTHEHLDYHQTYDKYVQAKAKLLRQVKYSILNQDDSSYNRLANRASGQVLTYGIRSSTDITATNVNIRPSGMDFEIPYLGVTIRSHIIGEYNVQNFLAAASVGIALGIDAPLIAEGLSTAPPPPGRLERVETNQGFSVFIDFAHTPNSFESVLKLLRGLVEGKLIVVFGCAGERDHQKRRPMGELAARYCDYVVITAEDPRTEDLDEIIAEIARGCNDGGGVRDQSYFCIRDRQEALDFAIQQLAHDGDIVIATGKAHEASMCFGTTEYPWNEFESVQQAINGHTISTEVDIKK